MVIRLTAVTACACLSLLAGCDDSSPPPKPLPTTAPATGTPAATANDAAPTSTARERIPLGAIPFTIEVPQGWRVTPGVTNQSVLRGKTPSGEVDILMGRGPAIKADILPLIVKQSTKASTDPHVKSEVVQRDKLTLIKSIAPQIPPGATASPDPELVPMGWTVQMIVSEDGKVDSSSFDLTVVGLSQAMFDKDEAFLQQIMDSIRYESAASRPAMP